MNFLRRCQFHTHTSLAMRQPVNRTNNLKTTNNKSFELVAFPEPVMPTAAELSAANKVFRKPVQFIKSISQVHQAPNLPNIPEIAFVGRSNVGKSTLINLLTNNHKLVKTSSKPGHTRLLNFFDIAGRLTLVDMPGYGFRSREEWGELSMGYFAERTQLKRIFLLLDPTAGLKSTDCQLMNHLDESALSYQVVLTKCDKLSPKAFSESKAAIEKYLVKNAICCYPHILAVGKRRKSQKNEDQVERELSMIRWSILSAAGIPLK